MDMRKWFVMQERPKAEDWYHLVHHVPCSVYRCEIVMRVFLAGVETGFVLTDKNGQPTEALRVMVRLMGAELVQVDDLPEEEQRNFTHHKGVVDPIFKGRWFIRNISTRFRGDSTALRGYGWAWYMFKGEKSQGLMYKRVTETTDGLKQRPMRFLAACPLDWQLSDRVYEGLWKWRHDNARRRVWDAYTYLAERPQTRPGQAPQHKGVAAADGHAEMVSA